MGDVKLFRGVIDSIAEGTGKGLRIAQLTVRGFRKIADVPMIEHKGLVSRSKANSGDVVLGVQVDDLVVGIGSDSKDRPAVGDGETILYADEHTYVQLKPDGDILVQSTSGSKIELATDGTVMVHGTTVTVKGDTAVNVLAPLVGLGKEAVPPVPLDAVLTCSTAQCLLLAVPHVGGSPHVSAKGMAP
jgi:phage gp45-like